MPSDIQGVQNLTTQAIVTIFGRFSLWEVPHLENAEPPVDHVCQVLLQWHQLSHFHLSECHLACYPSKVFICLCKIWGRMGYSFDRDMQDRVAVLCVGFDSVRGCPSSGHTQYNV